MPYWKDTSKRTGKTSWRYTISIDGHRDRGTLKAAVTAAQAKHQFNIIEAKFRQDVHDERVGKKVDHLFNDVFNEALKAGMLKKSMKYHYITVIRYFEGVKISKAIDHAKQLRREMLERGAKNSTINKKMSVVKRIMSIAYSEFGYLDNDDSRRIKKLKEDNQRLVFLTAEELDQLVDACEHEAVKKVMLIAAYTGLRRSELYRLTHDDFENGKIRFKRKDGRMHYLPVSSRLHKILNDVLPISETAPVHTLRHHFVKAREKCGMHNVTFHTLRHTFATMIVQNPDISLAVARDLMGHHNFEMLSRYTHTNLEVLENAVEKIGFECEREKSTKEQLSDVIELLK